MVSWAIPGELAACHETRRARTVAAVYSLGAERIVLFDKRSVHESVCVPGTGDNHPTHDLTGDTDLDRAVTICDAHMEHVPYMEGAQWEYRVAGCDKVIRAWDDSKAEKDRRASELKRQDDQDRAFVAQFVGGLK